MKFGSFDGGKDGGHIGVGLVEISKLFAMHDAIFLETEYFESV